MPVFDDAFDQKPKKEFQLWLSRGRLKLENSDKKNRSILRRVVAKDFLLSTKNASRSKKYGELLSWYERDDEKDLVFEVVLGGKCDSGEDLTKEEIEKNRQPETLTDYRMKIFNEVKEQLEKEKQESA